MAGRGSRFSGDGYNLPKPILPVNNNIMVVEAVNCLPNTDNKIFICLDEHIKNYGLSEILHDKFNECKISIIRFTEISSPVSICRPEKTSVLDVTILSPYEDCLWTIL